MTSSSKLSSRLTSSRARSSAMLFRSRSSSISSRAPGEGSCAYRGLLCQRPPIVATHQSMGFQPRIIEVIPANASLTVLAVAPLPVRLASRRPPCTTYYSLFHMTLHSYLSHTPRINIREFATTILPPRHPPYPLASNGLLRSAHQQWRPGTSLV